MKVKGFFKDISGIYTLTKSRNKRVKAANDIEIPEDKITKMARSMHPGKFTAVVTEIISETIDSKRITLSSKSIPLYKAGTYLTIELQIGESIVTRPYSIITSPTKAYKEKELEIIVKDYKDGFVSHYLCHELSVGDEVKVEVGLGEFYYDPFRDTNNIVAIAGGAGITPFIAMAHDIVDRKLDINLTIIYGSDNPNQIIAKDELDSLLQDNIKVIHVISGKYPFKGEKGFITSNIIKKYSPENPTYFICGPKIMYDAILKELQGFSVDFRRIRKESFAISDITKHPQFDQHNLGKVFKIEVHQGISITRIEAKAEEPIAVALERSGLKIHTACRGGQCGFCRIKVLSGHFFIPEENDFRRYTDKEFNYVHSCSTYPLSDLIIKINI